MPFAVERLLELRVRAVERAVVPVEAAAAFGGTHEERHEHRTVERAGFVAARVVCSRKDPCGRLTLQVGDGLAHIVAREEPFGARFHEAAHERAVFVQRRPPVRPMFLEREREVGAQVEILVERGERTEAKTAQRVVEMGSAHR